MHRVNLGLIGLGGVGRIHLDNCLHIENARVAAVADSSEQARQFAKSRGVAKVFDDFTKLLEDPSIDSVIVSVPTYLHSECAIQAAEQGKHIFVEKPLARNVREAKETVTKTSKAGIKTMVGYPLRFSKLAAIKSEIDNGHLGDVVVAVATNVWHGPFFPVTSVSVPSAIPSWWLNPELAGGGALIDLGSHMINLLIWFFGDKVDSVKSILGHRFHMPIEDHAVCFMKFRQGTLATINVGWYAQAKTLMMKLFGTAKTMSMALTDENKPSHMLNVLGLKSNPEALAFYNELNYFINCIINDQEPSPSATDALRDLEIISQAYDNPIQPFSSFNLKSKENIE